VRSLQIARRFRGQTRPAPAIRRWFIEAGLGEVAFDGAPEQFGVGVARRPAGDGCISSLPARLFTFVR